MKHTYYTVCPDCGAHLDPCERCDCLDAKESDGLFALEIFGSRNSLLENSYAIVEPGAEIKDGDAVAIEHKGTRLVGRYRYIKSKSLSPFSLVYPPIGGPIIVDNSVRILGRVNSFALVPLKLDHMEREAS